MIKFYPQNEWKNTGNVKGIRIVNLSVVHCRCGCEEWSLFVFVLGFGGIITRYGKEAARKLKI